MKPSPDPRKKHYGPQRHRGLGAALAQRLGEQFPRLGGPRILELCAQMILEVVHEHLRPAEHLTHGQVLWGAVALEERPRRGKRAQDTRLVPVCLTLQSPADLEGYLGGKTHRQPRVQRAVRMCQEAHGQGGLLSNVDLALLLGVDDTQVASMLVAYEREHGQVVPRRTTLHDMGSGLTHKRIIILRRHLHGKDPAKVARETYHCLDAVDRYLGQYGRVRHCKEQGLGVAETAHILGCGETLVRQYLAIDDEINQARSTPQP